MNRGYRSGSICCALLGVIYGCAGVSSKQAMSLNSAQPAQAGQPAPSVRSLLAERSAIQRLPGLDRDRPNSFNSDSLNESVAVQRLPLPQAQSATAEILSSVPERSATTNSLVRVVAGESADIYESGELDEGNGLVLAQDQTAEIVEPEIPPAPPVAGIAGAYPLSLGNVLYLADAQNPNVTLARERINEAYARVDRAEALWLPSIRAGINYVHHEGLVQDVVGNVFNVNKSSLYGGFGAAGGGSGSPAIPGLVAQFHVTDAIFQPRIAGHQAASRQFGAAAVRNDVLRNTALAYLELLRAEQALSISNEALVNTQKLVQLTDDYARTGQGLRSDYERMLAEQTVREAEIASRVEGVRVASARLAQLLHADPSVQITSNEPMVVPLDLFHGVSSAASHVATGLSRRPELAEQQHLVCEAVERLNREKYAPLVPSVLLGLSYGGMGGSPSSAITNSGDRFDADAMAFWEIRNLGFGERAARDEMCSIVRQAQQRNLALLDQVAREVVEAHAQVEERQKRLDISRRGIAAAERSYQLNVQRIENAQGLPIESLQSVQALAIARSNYLNAVIDYNISQFELSRATGWFENE